MEIFMNNDIIERLLIALVSGGYLPSDKIKKAAQAMNDAIADTYLCTWSVAEVFHLGKKLTHSQAITVLALAHRYHEPATGINWDVLDDHAEHVRTVEGQPYKLTDYNDEPPRYLLGIATAFQTANVATKKVTVNIKHEEEEAVAIFLQSQQIGALSIDKGCNHRTRPIISECSSIDDLIDRYLELDGAYIESPGEEISNVINHSFEIADSF
jgi:hypothetical protein